MSEIAKEARIVYSRSWRERLFSWPWRPWHNVRVFDVSGSVVMYGAAEFGIEDVQQVDARTARMPWRGP